MENILIRVLLKIYKIFKKEDKHNFNLNDLEYLKNFISSSKLVLFDIGSRSMKNTNGIPSRLNLLQKYSTLLICDADTSCMNESLETLLNKGWKSVKIFPYAISNNKEKFVKLHLTNQPGLSSLLKPNEYFLKKLPAQVSNDFSIKEEVKVSNRKLINVLDEFSLEGISHIDIDTQGTELEILKSGEKIIENSLISLTIEVSFQEIYKKQCLFRDIDAYLSKFGFEIFELDRIMVLNNPEINYSKKIISQGDALYFKNPDFIVNNHKKPGLDLMKLISMLITFYHFNDSLRILNDIKFRQHISSVYGDSKIKNLEDEIIACSEKFDYHNKVFLFSNKLRKNSYKDRDGFQH